MKSIGKYINLIIVICYLCKLVLLRKINNNMLVEAWIHEWNHMVIWCATVTKTSFYNECLIKLLCLCCSDLFQLFCDIILDNLWYLIFILLCNCEIKTFNMANRRNRPGQHNRKFNKYCGRYSRAGQQLVSFPYFKIFLKYIFACMCL